MLVLITYDVNTENATGKARLRKVAKQCVNYGRRVQNSVFECILDNAQSIALKATLRILLIQKRTVFDSTIWAINIRPRLNISG